MDYAALHKCLILQLCDTRSRDGAGKFQSRGCTGTTGRLLVLLCTALPTSKNRSAEELRSREGGWVINTLILVQLPVAMGRQARRHCHTKGHDATTATGPGPAGLTVIGTESLLDSHSTAVFPLLRPTSGSRALATTCRQLPSPLPKSGRTLESYINPGGRQHALEPLVPPVASGEEGADVLPEQGPLQHRYVRQSGHAAPDTPTKPHRRQRSSTALC